MSSLVKPSIEEASTERFRGKGRADPASLQVNILPFETTSTRADEPWPRRATLNHLRSGVLKSKAYMEMPPYL